MNMKKFPFSELYYDTEPHPCDGGTGRDLFIVIYGCILLGICFIAFTVYIAANCSK